jgi:hypothetical protein
MVSASNFVLDGNAIGGTNVDGHGHYHVYVDGTYVTASGEGTVYLEHVTPGEHTITVVLADNDHTETAAADYARVDVADAAMDVTIDSPSDGEVVTGDFYVSATADNFTLDDAAVGGADVDGEGHYHVLVDGAYYTYGTGAPVLVSGLAPGEHTLSVVLVQNDHTNVEPLVMDEVSITVQ